MPKLLPPPSADDNQQRAPPGLELGQEFKSIFENEIGREISIEEAQEYAESLISVLDFYLSNPP